MAAGSTAPRRWPRDLLALTAAWLLAAAWGSVVQTQFNLQALVALDVPVPPGLRARTTLQDLAGFAPVYAGILAAGWLPALGLAAWLAPRWPAARTALFAVAAGVGMVAAVRTVDALAPCRCSSTRRAAGPGCWAWPRAQPWAAGSMPGCGRAHDGAAAHGPRQASAACGCNGVVRAGASALGTWLRCAMHAAR
jgi:hypothetical protein